MGYDGKLKFDTGIDESGFNVGLDGLSSLADKGLSLLTSSFTAAFDGIKKAAGSAFDFIGDSVSVGAEFEASLSKVVATAGKTRDSMVDIVDEDGVTQTVNMFDTLSQKAQDLGASTQFSAAQVSDGFNYMAMAGWDCNQMLGGIDGILSLAAASGEDLATTCDIVTDGLTAFGLTSNDAAHFSDVLAKASSSANTNVSMMGNTFKYVAPVAGALGYSIEDCSIAIGLMANSGIKADQAGTALRAFMSRMADPTDEVAAMMDKLGLSITNSDGSMRSLNELMVDLRSSFATMSASEKAACASTLAGTEAMSGLLAIVNASDKDFAKMNEAMYNCKDAATDMAKAMTDNLSGDVTAMKSAFEGLQISLSESMNEGLRNIVQEATGYLQDLREAFVNDSWQGLGKKLGDSLTLALKNNEDSAIYAMRMGQQFVQSLAESLQKNSKRISQSLVKMITQGIRNSAAVYSTVYTVGLNIITKIASGLADNAVYITKTIISTLGKIVDSITENAPVLLQAGLTIIQALLDGISQNTEEIVTCIITLLNSLIECVNENIFVILDAALQIIFALADGLKANMPLLLESALQLIMALAQYIGDNIPLLIDCAIKILQTLIQFVFDNLPMLIDCAIEILQMLIQFVFENLPMLLECALGIIMGLVEYLLDDSTLNSLLDCAIEIITSLIAFIVNNLEPLLECAVQIISAIVMYIINNADKLLESAAELLSTLAVGLVSSAYLVIDAVAKLLADIWVKFSETDWGEIGHNIIEGVKNGFLAGFERVKETFNGAWDELKQNFCDFWDINSPSKVMADLSGYLPAGMGEGFKAGMPSALDEINTSLDSAASGIDIDSIYSQLQNLNLSQGAGAVPAYSDVIGQAYSHQQDSGLATSKTADTSNSAADGGNWTFPIYLFPNSDALDSIIVSAAARANIVSGGRSI